jgi:uncharacterized protein YcnI
MPITTTSSRSQAALMTGRLIAGKVSRGVAAVLVAAVALILVAAPANAHVGIASASTTDAVTTINFSFDHGCGSSPTIALEMQLPTAAQVVSTELMEGWVFDGTTGDGASTSQQVARISGPPIPDGQFASFTVVARGYDTSVDHLVPTVQLCEQGQEAWIDPDQASPQSAPFLAATTAEPPADLNDETTTTSTVAPGAGSGTADPQAPAEVTSTADPEADNAALATDEADATSSTLGIIIAAAIAVAVVAGIVMVVRSRRNTAA